MVNTTYNSAQELIDKLQQLKGETKINFFKNINIYYDEMIFRRYSGNFQFEEDTFSKNDQSIAKIYHDVLLLKNFFQTKQQFKNMNINCYDLYYTVIKNRDDKEIVDDKNENDFINFIDLFPNHYIGRKNDNVMLR